MQLKPYKRNYMFKFRKAVHMFDTFEIHIGIFKILKVPPEWEMIKYYKGFWRQLYIRQIRKLVIILPRIKLYFRKQ